MPNNLKDITGNVYGRLKVLHKAEKQKGSNTLWWVKCLDCEHEKSAQKGQLKLIAERGESGCPKCKKRRKAIEELVGLTIDKIKIIEYSHTDKNYKHYFLGKCQCGDVRPYQASGIRAKNKQKSPIFSCNSCIRRLDDTVLSYNLLFHQWRKGAKNRGVEFALNKEEAIAIASQNCFYCGVAPQETTRKRSDKHKSEIIFFSSFVLSRMSNLTSLMSKLIFEALK